jgi:hypothetical protein
LFRLLIFVIFVQIFMFLFKFNVFVHISFKKISTFLCFQFFSLPQLLLFSNPWMALIITIITIIKIRPVITIITIIFIKP